MKVLPYIRWRAQVLLALTVVVLTLTGLANWLLPHGGAARTLRHLLRWIHEGAAIGFLALLIFHLYFQSPSLRHNLHRFGLWGQNSAVPPPPSSAHDADSQQID